MKHKMLMLILAVVASVTLVAVGCAPEAGPSGGGTPAAGGKVEWRAAIDDPEGYPNSDALKAVCDEVNKNTDGKFIITPYYGAVLGDWSATNEMVMRGDLEMALAPIDSAWDPRLAISYYWPYLVKSYDEAKDFYKEGSLLYNITNNLMKPLGFQTLGAWPRGLSGVSLKDVPPEPGNPDVKKNMKIRVMPLKQCRLTYERLGYMCTAIPYGEVYSSIQTGVVDGQMGGGYMQATLFKDVQGAWVEYDDFCEHNWFLVNSEALNSLSEEYQNILLTACQRQCISHYDVIQNEDAKYEKELKDYGQTIIKLTPEEMDACATAVRKDVWPQLEDMVGRDIIYKLYDELGVPHD